MNEQFLELIQLLGDAGYEVKSITQENPPVPTSIEGICKRKPVDIVLHLSPIGKPKSAVTE
jgi:hypothetical protein